MLLLLLPLLLQPLLLPLLLPLPPPLPLLLLPLLLLRLLLMLLLLLRPYVSCPACGTAPGPLPAVPQAMCCCIGATTAGQPAGRHQAQVRPRCGGALSQLRYGTS